MSKLKSIYNNNKKLFSFIGLSYFDKMVIFLLPIAVLYLFKDNTLYVTIEYVYSIVTVLVPFLDLGLGSYFFFAYRNNDSIHKVISDTIKVFHILYMSTMLLGLVLIGIHYFIYPFEEQIIYIVFRCIFVLAFTFLTSYYRLINKPQKALFITIFANILSLTFLLLYFFTDTEIHISLIFIGQILFCIFYFFKIAYRMVNKWIKSYQSVHKIDMLKKSLLFSWPNIIQVFILMYVGNYGKINALDNLTEDEGVLLALTQRFSMLIQLTHGAIIGYLMKELFVDGELFSIKKNVFFKYIGLLLSSVLVVIAVVISYFYIKETTYDLHFIALIVSLIIGYIFLWCIYSYFEIYYSRENKNIIKMYLAIANGVSFLIIFNILELAYLERITFSMFTSTLITLLLSLVILRSRNYKFV